MMALTRPAVGYHAAAGRHCGQPPAMARRSRGRLPSRARGYLAGEAGAAAGSNLSRVRWRPTARSISSNCWPNMSAMRILWRKRTGLSVRSRYAYRPGLGAAALPLDDSVEMLIEEARQLLLARGQGRADRCTQSPRRFSSYGALNRPTLDFAPARSCMSSTGRTGPASPRRSAPFPISFRLSVAAEQSFLHEPTSFCVSARRSALVMVRHSLFRRRRGRKNTFAAGS